ncbi:MAG: phage tail tube protein [Planctomycetota bacterium]|nr:phage tail tube protein [Planctomycetota bacterium]
MAAAGYSCTLKIGGSAVAYARDVKLDSSAGTIDVSSRAGSGWKEFLAGLREWGVSIDHLWVPSNAQMQALRAAFLAGTTVTVQVLDDGGYGFSGTAYVTGIEHGQPLEGGVTFACTLKGTGALSVVTP